MNSKNKYADIPLSKFSAVAPYFFLILHHQTTKKALTFVLTIIKKFFLLQWSKKLHIRKIPVIKVDTELDDRIPFSPDHVEDYMSFVAFFIRTFDMLKKRLGYKAAVPYMNEFLSFLINIYSNAAEIYNFSMSTTKRPKYLKNGKFVTIHLFDPHLLCVPSIHVSIAAGTFYFYRQLFKKGILPQAEAEQRLAEIKKQAVAIIESVLFVKQHSINCVPTALYMISITSNKTMFPPEDAINFIEELFKTSTEITDEDRNRLTEHFIYLYERTYLEGIVSDNWATPIKHWLIAHAQKTNQNIPYSFTNDAF